MGSWLQRALGQAELLHQPLRREGPASLDRAGRQPPDTSFPGLPGTHPGPALLAARNLIINNSDTGVLYRDDIPYVCPGTGSIGITWEGVRNVHSRAQARPRTGSSGGSTASSLTSRPDDNDAALACHFPAVLNTVNALPRPGPGLQQSTPKSRVRPKAA